MNDEIKEKHPEHFKYLLTESEAKVVAKRWKNESIINFPSRSTDGHIFIKADDLSKDDAPTCIINELSQSDADGLYEHNEIWIEYKDMPIIAELLLKLYNKPDLETKIDNLEFELKYKDDGMDLMK